MDAIVPREVRGLRHGFNPPPDRVLQEGDVLIGGADTGQRETARRIAAGAWARIWREDAIDPAFG